MVGLVLFFIVLEVVLGVEDVRVEECFFEEFECFCCEGIVDDEYWCVQKMIFVDWIFGYECIQRRVVIVVLVLVFYDECYLQILVLVVLEVEGVGVMVFVCEIFDCDWVVVVWLIVELLM